MKKISRFKLSMFMAWDWIVEYKWLLLTIVGVFAVNVMSMETIFKTTLVLMAVAAVSWIYYISMGRYYRNKLLNLTENIIDDNDKKAKLIKSQRSMIKYLEGKPVTVMDKNGNIKTIQKGKPDDTISTMN